VTDASQLSRDFPQGFRRWPPFAVHEQQRHAIVSASRRFTYHHDTLSDTRPAARPTAQLDFHLDPEWERKGGAELQSAVAELHIVRRNLEQHVPRTAGEVCQPKFISPGAHGRR
jgi:hypothetical protein